MKPCLFNLVQFYKGVHVVLTMEIEGAPHTIYREVQESCNCPEYRCSARIFRVEVYESRWWWSKVGSTIHYELRYYFTGYRQ